ncbi:MAG TPA: acyltransferase [Acidimicrobiia bacterium]|jgi:peptidoglycan/LPS O-acetylase OafA/YrhL|nr:acyltransferase [Acidimicrobiia bacterium]HIL47331.1 acyltransferase [Acidimicrobiia bacterium]
MSNPAPSPSSTTSPRRWFEGLNGLRAIAALLIVVDHSAESSGLTFRSEFWGPYLARLDIGVSIFFALSGFLLFYPFVKAQFANQPAPPTKSFWFRRALRIYPGYWVALIIVLAFDLGRPVKDSFGFFMSFGLLHTYTRDINQVFSGITQSWSLVTELGFYLVLPLLAWVGGKLGKGKTINQQAIRLLAWCAFLALASLASRAAIFLSTGYALGSWGSNSMSWTPAYLDIFAAGMALAVLSAWREQHPEGCSRLQSLAARPWLWWSSAAFLYWGMCTQLNLATGINRSTFELEVVRQSIYGLIGVCLIVPIAFSSSRSTLTSRLLESRLLNYLGVVSYGIYLWHQAFINLAHRFLDWPELTGSFWVILTFGVLGSIGAAGLSHRFVETPLTKAGKSLLNKPGQPKPTL